jgi:hypothetical protein
MRGATSKWTEVIGTQWKIGISLLCVVGKNQLEMDGMRSIDDSGISTGNILAFWWNFYSHSVVVVIN